uniref:SAP domain-containing protein n=1 Tax=Biomphalaria glabrata TaxID=6526 RepID=A0A2C9LW08_BIOGL
MASPLMKQLDQLLIKELKQEFRYRGLKLGGSKETLTARLRQALIEEEEDPDSYQFEVGPDITELLSKMQEKMELLGKMQEKMDTLDIVIRTMQDKIDTLDSGIRTELVSVNQKITTMEVTMNQRVDVVEKDIEELKVQVREGLSKAPVSNTGSMLPEGLVKMNTGSMLPEGLVKMKPPVFDGSVSWSIYRRQFEAATKVNKWGSEEEKATALVLALRGKASEVLQSIPNQQDYAALVHEAG